MYNTPNPSRSTFTTKDIIHDLWTGLHLPQDHLTSLSLPEESKTYYQTSFKISKLAQSTIALSALTAALVQSVRNNTTALRKVSVPLRHACLEFQTEKLFTVDGKAPPSSWGPIGGLHAARDGFVRIHDNFPHHRDGALKVLGLEEGASREDVSVEVARWEKVELEEMAYRNGLPIYALRSFGEWDALPQASAVSDFPISIQKIGDAGPKSLPSTLKKGDGMRCLEGLRVLELSRVIAAPVAGKTLAAHGADVIWLTSPNLPDLPSLDMNLSRGKRSVQLELNNAKDRSTLRELVKDCDVFIQGYRPGSVAAKGFGPEDLAKINPGIVYANLSAFGPEGPWSDRRGFDSLVQTCTGMNASEAEHHGSESAARPTPVQALDHGGGFLLAAGISTALYRRAMEGGSWEVHVSLARVMKYLRSLGQWDGREGFGYPDPAEGEIEEYFEEKESGFGMMRGLKHAAVVDGAMPGFDRMSKPLGSDEARWL